MATPELVATITKITEDTNTIDNYDAIDIPYTDAIPSDYDGIMGVPITFLDKYNPEQFKIINGLNRYALLNNDKYILNNGSKRIGKHMCSINNGKKFSYFRILIKKRTKL